MLRIFICPECFNYRIVSRKPDAFCFHCGSSLEKLDLDYNTYIQMNEEDRITYKENYKARMKLYVDKFHAMLQEKHLH